MKQYEQPTMDILKLVSVDVITLSEGDETYDPKLEEGPWAQKQRPKIKEQEVEL